MGFLVCLIEQSFGLFFILGWGGLFWFWCGFVCLFFLQQRKYQFTKKFWTTSHLFHLSASPQANGGKKVLEISLWKFDIKSVFSFRMSHCYELFFFSLSLFYYFWILLTENNLFLHIGAGPMHDWGAILILINILLYVNKYLSVCFCILVFGPISVKKTLILKSTWFSKDW